MAFYQMQAFVAVLFQFDTEITHLKENKLSTRARLQATALLRCAKHFMRTSNIAEIFAVLYWLKKMLSSVNDHFVENVNLSNICCFHLSNV